MLAFTVGRAVATAGRRYFGWGPVVRIPSHPGKYIDSTTRYLVYSIMGNCISIQGLPSPNSIGRGGGGSPAVAQWGCVDVRQDFNPGMEPYLPPDAAGY